MTQELNGWMAAALSSHLSRHPGWLEYESIPAYDGYPDRFTWDSGPIFDSTVGFDRESLAFRLYRIVSGSLNSGWHSPAKSLTLCL